MSESIQDENIKSNLSNGVDFGNEQVIELLNDDAFPPMVLVDGAWGSGKTHYVQTQLIPLLKDRFSNTTCHYMSLYGVSDINDFRDRIISLCLSGSENSKQLASHLTKLADSIGVNQGERGIGGLLNGISGAYKYSIYSNLENKVFVLDDLERVVNPENIKNILGECFNLVDKKNEVKILVVANSQKIKIKADLEKTFHDKITIQYTAEQIVKLIKPAFLHILTPALEKELVQFLKIGKDLTLTNIRVLKRALRKFEKLQSKLESVEYINIEFANSKILRQIVSICFAHYEKDYSVKEIKSAPIISSIMKAMIEQNKTSLISDNKAKKTEKEQEKKLRQDQLDFIFPHSVVHEYLVDFCCEGKDNFTNIVEELNLPIEDTPLNKILNYQLRFKMTSNEFEQGAKAVEDYIKTKTYLHFGKFFNCCDCLITLISKEYIKSDYTEHEIIDICNNLKIEYFDITSMPNHNRFINLMDGELQKIWVKKSAEFKNKLNDNQKTKFSNSFNKSFKSVIEQLYDEQSYKPFLQRFSKEELTNSFLNWSEDDIHTFACFLEEQYNFSNIEEYFEPQHDVLVNTENLLKTKIEEIPPSLKKGTLNELYETLTKINSQMTDKLKSKE